LLLPVTAPGVIWMQHKFVRTVLCFVRKAMQPTEAAVADHLLCNF